MKRSKVTDEQIAGHAGAQGAEICKSDKRQAVNRLSHGPSADRYTSGSARKEWK